jgi:hypothetical protein
MVPGASSCLGFIFSTLNLRVAYFLHLAMPLTDCWIAAHALTALPFYCAHTAGELIPKPNAAGSRRCLSYTAQFQHAERAWLVQQI